MLQIREKLKHKEATEINGNPIFKPQFFRLHDPDDRISFLQLLSSPGISVYDYLFGTIKELVKTKTPSRKFNDNELESEALKHISPLSLEEYGVWVYYPWANRMVHILDREEFIDVRTSRNQYKITREERDILSEKKIGVIGLSVGQSVSLTVCMERICGEIRLADFDTLELTNLNRIRTGVHNLGLPKVYAVAREIAEIDPFIEIKCFVDGITDSNMHDFFSKDGKLDLLIEESDGFDIKILSRYKARELGIPVLMEASDRCMVDVERFDLEPERSILHGLVDHLDMDTLKSLKTNEEKIPYMLDILGLETSSLRLKASMLEIEQSINTWPQLASAVTMGGGITADVARRVLLGSYNESGRYHVDIEELIGNRKQKPIEKPNEYRLEPIDFIGLANRIQNTPLKEQVNLSEQEAKTIIEASTTAPSGGNAQPWRWVYKNNSLLLFNAFDSNHNFMGYKNYASYIALGACIENVVLKARQMHFDSDVKLFPDKNIKDFVASVAFFPEKGENKKDTWLANGIDKRLTNRKITQRQVIEQNILDEMMDSVNDIEGAKLDFFTADDELRNIGHVLGEAEKIRLLEKLGHHDFVEEIRWTVEENDRKRDGVDIRTVDVTNTELVGLQVAKNSDVMALIRKWDGGGAFKKLTVKSIDSAGAIGVLSMPGKTDLDYLNGGRALQRAWITANLKGIAFQPTASSLFMYERLFGGGEYISETGAKKLWELRPAYEKAFNLKSGRGEIFFFRLLKAAEPEVKSLRKPLVEIYKYIGNG